MDKIGYREIIRAFENNLGKSMADSWAVISHIARMSNIDLQKIELLVSSIISAASVAVHFHPDRLTTSGISVAASLLEDGLYKNQFETGISNGQLDPEEGGLRDMWERDLFSLSKTRPIALCERPKYGALDLLKRTEGPSPRFGSCYFILKPEVTERCTFSFQDSHYGPKERGTLQFFNQIIEALLTESFERETALGLKGIQPDILIDLIIDRLSRPYSDPELHSLTGNLDFYIEAQIHGPVNLQKDIFSLVGDASFKESTTGKQLLQLGEMYGFPVLWHKAFEMDLARIPSNFRGPEMPTVAKMVAENGKINARLIGKMARIQSFNINTDIQTLREFTQQLKYLWHVLVKYGV